MTQNKVDYNWGYMIWHLDGEEAKPTGMSMATMVLQGEATSEQHLHDNCYEMFLVEEGSVQLILDGKTIFMNSGDSQLIAPEQKHVVTNRLMTPAKIILSYSAASRNYTPTP